MTTSLMNILLEAGLNLDRETHSRTALMLYLSFHLHHQVIH